MIELFAFCLICYGATQIICFGSILDKIRPTQGWMGKLLSCPMCTGFWVGVLTSTQYQIDLLSEHIPVDMLLHGFVSSGICYFFGMLVNDYGLKITLEKKNENTR